MPYYVHPTGEDPADTARVCFPNSVQARAAKQSGEVVTFIANPVELDQWEARERHRFTEGTYIEVPWSDYQYDQSPDGGFGGFGGLRLRHFAHLSLKFAGQVAFTKSSEHGMLDRQTVMRPGRYLEQFFPDERVERRTKWIGIVSSLKSNLHIATTPDEIERVYIGGPESCMSHEQGDYACDEHPVRVYGNSDLAVAYCGAIDEANGRAIVWPAKKIHGRVYGSEAVMVALLEQAGYTRTHTETEWIGAKIRCLENDDGRYIMPYLDIADTIDITRIEGKRWCIVAGRNGAYNARNTDGRSGPRSSCGHCGTGIADDETLCESCLDNSCCCPDCDEPNWDDNSGGYCASCYESYSTCEHCDDVTHGDNTHYLDRQGITICDSCYAGICTCEVCEEPFLEAAYPARIRRHRTAELNGRVCYRCQETGASLCNACDTARAGGETCECETHDSVEQEEVVVCAS